MGADADELLLALSSPAIACAHEPGGKLEIVFQNAAAKRIEHLKEVLKLVDVEKGAQEVEQDGQRVLVQLRSSRGNEAPYRKPLRRSSPYRPTEGESNVVSPLLGESQNDAPLSSVAPRDQLLGSTVATDGQTGKDIERTVWQSLLKAVPACAIVMDPAGRPLFVSKTDYDTFKSCAADGWPDKSVLPDHLHALHADGSKYERTHYPMVRCLENNEVVRGEMLRYHSNQDGEVYLRYTATPVFRKDNEDLLAVTAIIENVTDAELQHAELRRLQAERKAKARISVFKDQFIGTISHELRTPLNGIMGLVELLESSTDHIDHDTLIRDIRDSADGLALVINDLLTLQAISSAQPQALNQSCDLQQLMDRVIRVQRSRQPSGADISIETHFASSLRNKLILCDRARLELALGHIVNNAVRFSEPHAVVLAKAWTACAEDLDIKGVPISDQYVVMEVEDSGRGMDADTISNLFEPFFQADSTSQRDRNGAGVGATVARAMLLAHHGDIRVMRSTLGQGTVIQLYLPLIDAPVRATWLNQSGRTGSSTTGYSTASSSSELSMMSASSTLTGTSSPGKRRILAVDDERINLLVLQRALEKGGYEVVTAVNGLEAVNAFREASSPFDLIVLDIHMPVLSGVEAGAQIRALQNGEMVPIIAFTATEAPGTIAECERLSMRIVHKPCPPKELLEVINKML